jgi:hypothetical protein
MNRVHSAIIRHIRNVSSEMGGQFADHFSALSDEQIVRIMFSNFRGKGEESRGLRLTNMGLEVMRAYFKAYDIPLPEGHKIEIKRLLYLDRRASLPFYYSNERLILFEGDLGLKLKLADGDLDILMEIDGAL